jgi:WD40 repeat protein
MSDKAVSVICELQLPGIKPVLAMDVHSSSNHIAVGSTDGTIFIWDVTAGAELFMGTVRM